MNTPMRSRAPWVKPRGFPVARLIRTWNQPLGEIRLVAEEFLCFFLKRRLPETGSYDASGNRLSSREDLRRRPSKMALNKVWISDLLAICFICKYECETLALFVDIHFQCSDETLTDDK